MKATLDSRKVEPGDIFIALKGEKVDGHDFIPQALQKGASRVIGSVEELQSAAREYRRTLKAKIIGVTGSAGKTTTKEFLKTFLNCYGTEGNYNNHLGVPITLLNAPQEADFVVVEMGTNHPGEIAALCDIAEPDVGVICSIGTAHLEFFKTQSGIWSEKSVLLKRAKDWGMVAESVAEKFACDALKHGQECPLPCPLPGEHNKSNMDLAYAVARKLGVSHADCAQRLQNFQLPGARWRKTEQNGVTFIDDSYNANPDSMIAALDTFTGNTVILGDMGELGEMSLELHTQVLKHAIAKGFKVITTGPMFTKAQISLLRPGDQVLLKASHSMGLSALIERNK